MRTSGQSGARLSASCTECPELLFLHAVVCLGQAAGQGWMVAPALQSAPAPSPVSRMFRYISPRQRFLLARQPLPPSPFLQLR